MRREKMRVMVTGGAGYIGSVLARELLASDHSVICLDRLFFGEEPIIDLIPNRNFKLIRDDIRCFDPNILKGIDAVIDLAALSNDPSGEIDPLKTFDINYIGRSRVARLSKEFGVKRYILASSCSLYGFQDQILDETSRINPLTTYAKASRKAEEDVLPLASEKFTVTVLRFATVYGYSKRMRFDLALNAMVLSLYKQLPIKVMRDGTQWRPFLHIKDVSEAYKLVLAQPSDAINGEIYNVGSDDQNFQILPLAKTVSLSLKVDTRIEWYGSPDFRSYQISFKKFRDLADFRPAYTPNDGALEIHDALTRGETREDIKTLTVDWYKYLINSYDLVKQVSIKDTIL